MRKPEKNTVVFKIFPTDMVFLSKHEKIARKKKCSIFLILTFFPFFFSFVHRKFPETSFKGKRHKPKKLTRFFFVLERAPAGAPGAPEAQPPWRGPRGSRGPEVHNANGTRVILYETLIKCFGGLYDNM